MIRQYRNKFMRLYRIDTTNNSNKRHTTTTLNIVDKCAENVRSETLSLADSAAPLVTNRLISSSSPSKNFKMIAKSFDYLLFFYSTSFNLLSKNVTFFLTALTFV
jgi:hypothetical protein